MEVNRLSLVVGERCLQRIDIGVTCGLQSGDVRVQSCEFLIYKLDTLQLRPGLG